MWNEILYNKRTSICGVIVAGAVFFRIFFPQKEPLINQIVEALIGLVGAAGLLLAKDGGKSGVAARPNP
jgi:hypothetical protein